MMNNYLQHYGIKGMKWGIRRYQNKDGSLTSAGKRRYDRDVRENLAKKKDNRIDTSDPDPKRWVREDVERTKRVVDATSNLVRQTSNLEKSSRTKSHKESIDLSKMSDKELREKINRKLLEKQYLNMFEEEAVSEGRKSVSDALNVAGNVLAVTGSALSIALAVKELKG